MFYFPRFSRELETLQQTMNQLFDGNIFPKLIHYEQPLTNVYMAQEGDLEITLPLPGVEAKDIEITHEQQSLQVKGKRHEDIPQDAKVLRTEREMGTFQRTISLPCRVNPETISAAFSDGILTIKASQLEADKPHRITITS